MRRIFAALQQRMQWPLLIAATLFGLQALLFSQPALSQGAPASITPVSGSGQSTVVNTAFANELRVIVQDSTGATLANTPVTFSAPVGSPTTIPTAVFGGSSNTTTVNTNASGAAIVPAALVSASQRSGQYNVDVTAGSASTTILLINAAGPPASIAVDQGAGQSVTVGTDLPTQLVARVLDGFSNPVSGATVVFTAPSTGASGNFSGSLTATRITNASGLATAPTFTTNSTAGVYNVVANTSPTPLGTPANFNLVNLPGAATQISVNQGSGQSTVVNTAFGTTLRALVRDASNNPVPNVSVTFTVVPGGGGASGSFSGGSTFTVTTDASGFAAATTLTANTTAGAFTVGATFTGGPTATFNLTNLAGAAASIAAQAGDNQSATITLSFSTNLAVVVRDAFGNAVSGALVTFTAPGSGASGLFGSSLTRTATTSASGIATATTFTANATAGTYSVVVTYLSLSFSFTLTNANPAAIVTSTGTPQSTTITTNFGTLMSARVTNAGGTGIAGLVVTFTAPGSGASGTFAGGAVSVTATTDGGGLATAPAFTANSTAGSYAVTASVTGVATPASFSLTNSNPAGIAVQAGNGQQATISTAFPTRLIARVTNSGGAGIAGMVVTFTASASAASGTFAGSLTTTATTNASGDAQATVLTANGTVGAHTVNATVTGVASPAPFNLTNLTPTPVTIAASPTGATPQSTAINAAFATALGVIIRDVNGIAITSYPVTFTVNAVGGAGASFSGGGTSTTVNTNGSGIATAPMLTANGTAGAYTVTATAGSLTFTFNLTNLAPALITATAGTPQTALINTNFGTQLQVTVVDGSSVPVGGVTVTFTAPATGASGAFSGSTSTTAVTNASGVATASLIRANGTTGTYTVNATVAGVSTPAAFSLTNTTPASVSATAGTPQSAVVSTNYATQLQATVRDASNAPVQGVTVTFTAPGSGATGTFGGAASTTATTNASGVATAAIIAANATAGNFTVNATVAGVATPGAFDLTNVLATPATATATAGSTPQSTAVGTAFATALGVLVRDAGGTIIVGIPVTFTVNGVTAGATFTGGLTSTTVNTNGSGIATAPTLTANATAGSYTVTATVGALSVVFSLSNTAAPASIAATAGNGQSATIALAFSTQLQATVRDSAGVAIPGAVVAFTAPTTGARATFSGSSSATVVANASGIATAPVATAGTVAGSYSVIATVQGTAISTTFTLTNTPGAPSAIARISGNSQSSPLGAAFAQPLVAVVRDGSGNAIPGVTVTFTAPTTGARATFPGGLTTVTATTDSSGNATSPALTATGVTGNYSVNAAATGGTNPSVNFSLTNTAAVAASVGVQSGSGQTTVVNTNFGSALQAIVRDTLGNPASGVTVTFAVPSTGASGGFGGSLTTTAITNSAGVATSSTMRANTVAGTFFAQATITGSATPAVYTLTNTPDTPVAISIVQGTPQATIVTNTFSTALMAQVSDVYGNVVPGAAVNWLAPSVGSIATFPGPSNTAATTTNSTGRATAPTLTANNIAGSYTVTASIPAGAFVNYNLTNQPMPTSMAATGGSTQTTPIATSFGIALQVVVRDNLGQPIPGITVTFTVPGSGASATLSAMTATTNASGVASVTATANSTSGSYVVNATVTGIATPLSFNLTNTAGSAASISATGGNTQTTAISTAFGTALQVTVRDGSNNPVSGVLVTYAVPGSGASAALSSLTATTNTSGIASVTATANATTGSYVVTASVAGVATPAQFNLTNTMGTPNGIVATGGNTQSAPVTTGFGTALQVTVRDLSNNPISGVVVTYVVPGSGASATLSSLTATTNAAGIASVTATANTTAGSYVVTASVAGVATPANFNLTNTAGTVNGIVASGGNTQSAPVTTGFGTALQVTVRDLSNNPISGAVVTYVVPGSGASATLSTLTATTNASGIASVTATANSIAGSYVVTASVAGVATPAQFNLTNTVGAPNGIVATGGNTQSAPVTTGFGTALQVTVRDLSNNPISGVVVTYVVPGSGASATLSSLTATTNASGIASVTATANSIAGSYVVTASVAGVATPAQFNLTNTGTAGLQLAVSTSTNLITGINQSIIFRYTVTNSGNVPITTLIVVDNKVTGITCPATTLAVGASMICTATYVTTSADIAVASISSVAQSTGMTTAGIAVSNVVTTRLNMDAEAVRRRTVAANKGLMESRAQLLSSMPPNAQRLHQRLSSSIFGGDGGDDEPSIKDPSPAGTGRHDSLKAFGVPAAGGAIAGLPIIGGTNSQMMTIAPQPSSLSGSVFEMIGMPGMPLGYGRDGMHAGGLRNNAQLPFSFGGSAEDGSGRFNFAGSLSQMRKAAEADQTAKLASTGSAMAPQRAGKHDDVFDMWVEGQSASYTTDRVDGRRRGHAAVLHAGADVIVAPGVLVGVVVQRDWIKETSSALGETRDGAGWMMGPYIGLRLNRSIFFDASYMRGNATNHTNPLGAYIDTFNSMREQATARLTGDWTHGAWRFRPSVEARYYSDRQKAYVNQIGIHIPETRVTLGTASFGPEVGYRMQLSDKSILEPYIGIKGVWDFAKDRHLSTTGATAAPEVFRGRIEAGASYRAPNGVTLRASGAYDGLGSDTYHAWQGQAFLIVPIR